MVIIDLFEDACNIKDERDFSLSSEEIKRISSIKDSEIVSIMLWLRQNNATTMTIDTDINDHILWLKFHLDNVNLRTKMYCFVRFLSLKNPLIKPVLDRILESI